MKEIILKNKLTNEVKKIQCDNVSIFEGSNWEIIYTERINTNKGETRKKKGNGEGTLYFSETLQKWVGQYTTKDGVRHTMTQKKNEKASDFKKKFNDVLANINNGTYIEKSKETLHEILVKYIEQKYKDGIISPSSYTREMQTLGQVEKTCSNFLYIPIQKVTEEDIEDAKDKMRVLYSKSCIEKIWIMLKTGFNIALARRRISYNLIDDVTLKKPLSVKQLEKTEALTLKEEEHLRSILNNEEKDHKYRNIAMMQLETGMRIGEVLARSIDDVNLEENLFKIWNTLTLDKKGIRIVGEHTKIYNKTTGIDKGKRTIPMSNEVRKIILEIIHSPFRNIHNLLFWDYDNNSLISHKEINSWLKRLNEKYHITDKSLSSHVLRHSRITRLQEIGVPLIVVQYMVGHVEGSRVTDEVYTSVSLDFVNNELKKANII